MLWHLLCESLSCSGQDRATLEEVGCGAGQAWGQALQLCGCHAVWVSVLMDFTRVCQVPHGLVPKDSNVSKSTGFMVRNGLDQKLPPHPLWGRSMPTECRPLALQSLLTGPPRHCVLGATEKSHPAAARGPQSHKTTGLGGQSQQAPRPLAAAALGRLQAGRGGKAAGLPKRG